MKDFGVAAVFATSPKAFANTAKAVAKPRRNPNLPLLFSDRHMNGHLDEFQQYQRIALEDTVRRILALDPLSAP